MLLLFSLLVFFGVSAATAADPVRVLFIGNSLTYWNEMPATFCRMAARAAKRVECDVVAFPDHDLADHLQRGDAAKRLRQKRWTWVVLQQGPSAAESSRVRLIDSVKRFSDLIGPSGARIAVFAAWPSRSRSGDFDRALESAALAAEAVGGTLIPVAAAWRGAWARDASMPLYAPDGLHPSPAASYLSALVVNRALFGELPRVFGDPTFAASTARSELHVTPEQLEVLRAAADEGRR